MIIVILILFSVNLSETDLLRTNRKEIPRGHVKVLLFVKLSKISLADLASNPHFVHIASGSKRILIPEGRGVTYVVAVR
jgi:hypothetical protein